MDFNLGLLIGFATGYFLGILHYAIHRIIKERKKTPITK
jgi:hypothetical protein